MWVQKESVSTSIKQYTFHQNEEDVMNTSCRIKSLGILGIVLFMLMGYSTVLADLTVDNVGNFGGTAKCAVAAGNYVYLAQSRVLNVFDNSSGTMERITSLTLDEEPDNMMIVGSTIYAFSRWSDNGIQIIDITTPDSPALTGNVALQTSSKAQGFVSDGYAYVAMYGEVKIIDISGTRASTDAGVIPVDANCVYVAANYCFIGHETGMSIYDVSTPAAPVHRGDFPSVEVEDLFVSGDYAYLAHASYPSWGVNVVNISDLDAPTANGFVETKIVINDAGGTHTYYKNPKKVVVQENHAYIGCEGSAHLFIADIADPANPALTGYVELVDESSWLNVKSLSVLPTCAYLVTGDFATDMFMIDITDPAAPVVLDRLNEPTEMKHLCTKGDTVFLAGRTKLWAYRIADPLDPVPELLADNEEFRDLRRIFVQGDQLFGIHEDSLVIVDISDLTNMQLLGKYASPNGFLRELHVLGNYAYLLGGGFQDGVIDIVNVSDAAAPVKDGEYTLPGQGRDIFVTEGSVYIYAGFYTDETRQGFQILDATDPADIVLLSETATSGTPNSIYVEQNLLCVGSYGVSPTLTWFLEAFNVQDKANPVKHDEQTGPGMLWDVKIKDKIIVASIQDNCLWFFMGLAYLYAEDATFAEFDDFMFDLAQICPSPASIFIDYLYYLGSMQYMLWLSIDGYGCPDFLDVWANIGVFIQRMLGVDIGVESNQADFRLPTKFSLSQNYPNPFNPSTTISFNVKESCHVSLKVYNVYGQLVETLANADYAPGRYHVTFNAINLAAGTYFYRIKAGDFVTERRMTLVK